MLRASVFNGLVIIAAIQDIRNTVIASAVNFTLDPALIAGCVPVCARDQFVAEQSGAQSSEAGAATH